MVELKLEKLWFVSRDFHYFLFIKLVTVIVLVEEEKVKMPFLKVKLPGEQTELTEKEEVMFKLHVHYLSRQIRNLMYLHTTCKVLQ